LALALTFAAACSSQTPTRSQRLVVGRHAARHDGGWRGGPDGGGPGGPPPGGTCPTSSSRGSPEAVHGPETDYENTFVTYLQLKARVGQLFATPVWRGTDAYFTSKIALLGGADFKTTFS